MKSSIISSIYNNGQLDLSTIDLSTIDLDDIPKILAENPEIIKSRVIKIRGRSLKEFPSFLFHFTQFTELKTLELYNCSIKKLEFPEVILKRLTTLVLSNNSIDEFTFPDGLDFVPVLRTLILSENGLTSLPTGLIKFTNLTKLHLEKNNLNESSFMEHDIKKFFKSLDSLVTLDLSFNSFKTFPSNLVNYKKIKKLNLNNNYLASFKIDYNSTSSLARLSLKQNFLTELDFEGAILSRLRFVNLGYNKLQYFPECLVRLERLRYLNIGNNQIKNIPREICERLLVKKRNGMPVFNLHLENCPVTTPPRELFQNLELLKEYLASVFDKTIVQNINETKMIVVGEGDVGKTSLIATICNDDYKLGNEIRTKGIDLSSWTYSSHGENINLNIWDFGGQEIYHSTHQFFFTTRTIYLYVLNVRRDVNSDTDYYWLNLIKLLGKDSPVIVVVNKIDLLPNQRDIYEFQKINENVIGIIHTSCETKVGIDKLKEFIVQQIDKMDLTIKLTESWLKLRTTLFNLQNKDHKDVITKRDFIQLCADLQITDECDLLLETFNLLGFVFYYGEDIYLDSLIILNPLWITKAIYCIFDDEAVSKKNGLISTIEIKRVWGDRLFIDHSAQLISIMRKFNICYEIEAGKSYLIPQLIKDKKIDSNLTSDFDFIVSYDYKFMPKGIISILINNLYEYIDGNNYSKDRILFARDANTILLEEKYYDRQINCYIQGTNYLPLFFLIRDTISKLKNQFPNIEFTEKISCQCFECKRARSIINTGFFEVDFLRRKTNNGANFVDCQKSAESVEISGMLGLFDFLSPNRHTKASFCELVVGKVLGEIFPPTDIKRGFQFKENGWEYDFVIIDKKNKEYVIIEVKAQNSKNPIEVGSDSKEQGTLRWFFESKFPYIEKRILSSQHPMFEGYVFKASYFSLSGFTGDSVSYFASHDKLTPSRLELFYDRTKMEHLLTTNNMGQEKKELKRFT